jgi:hypothetical protein
MKTSFVSSSQQTSADISLRDSRLFCSSFLTISTARYTRCSLERVFELYSRFYHLLRSKSSVCEARLTTGSRIFASDKENKVFSMRYVITTKYASP